MSFIRIGRHEVNPDYIQYVHENEEGDYTAYIGVGEHATKVTFQKGPEAKLIIDRLRHSGPIKDVRSSGQERKLCRNGYG